MTLLLGPIIPMIALYLLSFIYPSLLYNRWTGGRNGRLRSSIYLPLIAYALSVLWIMAELEFRIRRAIFWARS